MSRTFKDEAREERLRPQSNRPRERQIMHQYIKRERWDSEPIPSDKRHIDNYQSKS
jgi:hypothetical protein